MFCGTQFCIMFWSLAKKQISKLKCLVFHKSSIDELPFKLPLKPPFCQTDVGGNANENER